MSKFLGSNYNERAFITMKEKKRDLRFFVFMRIRQKISSLSTTIVYENFIFKQESAFAERCCFLTFSFEGKFRKYDIFRETVAYEN